MLERFLDTEAFLTAQGALTGLAARHAAIADNIANVNTPGYKRREVPFEAALARAVRDQVSPCTGAAVGPICPFVPMSVREPLSTNLADGNNVDVEMETVRMAENSLRYQVLTQYVTGFFGGLKSVINGAK